MADVGTSAILPRSLCRDRRRQVIGLGSDCLMCSPNFLLPHRQAPSPWGSPTPVEMLQARCVFLAMYLNRCNVEVLHPASVCLLLDAQVSGGNRQERRLDPRLRSTASHFETKCFMESSHENRDLVFQ